MRNPHLTFLAAAIKATGNDLPADFTQMVDELETITDAASYRADTIGYARLAEVWSDAILAGRDPGSDPKILNVLVANSIADGNIEYAAHNIVENRFIAKLPNIQDKILKQLADTVTKSGQAMTKAHEILGNTPIDDVHQINHMGPAALQASIDAREANTTVRTVRSGWLGLAHLTRFAPTTTEMPMIMADLDINTWNQVRRTKDPWTLIQHGATLNLATTHDEIERRQARLDGEGRDLARRQEEIDRRARGQSIAFK